ncbi:MAG: hypothetical protein ACFFDN_47965, partial [Candidatus Hodarchaeota archaeon]
CGSLIPDEAKFCVNCGETFVLRKFFPESSTFEVKSSKEDFLRKYKYTNDTSDSEQKPSITSKSSREKYRKRIGIASAITILLLIIGILLIPVLTPLGLTMCVIAVFILSGLIGVAIGDKKYPWCCDCCSGCS